MLAFALLVALRKAMGFQVFMFKHVQDRLRFFFKGIRARHMPYFEDLCENEFPWQDWSGSVANVSQHPDHYQQGQALDLNPNVI